MDNPNIDNAESVKNPSPFITFTARTIPATFDTSMSYQEALFALVNYLQTQVTPAVNGNAEVTNEQTKAINDLYNYVDQYFDNLDVQEEINNKLDDMAESGQLAEIITAYLQANGVLAFQTLNDLHNATNIIEGSVCRTLGNSTYNDGLGGLYLIRTMTSGDTVDGFNIVTLTISNTLIAERLVKDAQKVKPFDTISALHNATNITNGDLCYVCGYNSYSDGFGSYYRIRTKASGETADGFNLVSLTLSENLIGERIVNNGEKYLIIGDSYLEGAGLTNPTTENFGARLREKLGMSSTNCVLLPEGASGFISIGNQGHTFLTLLQANIGNIDTSNTTKIIVCGGVNDSYENSANQIENAIQTFVNYCKSTFNKADVYLACISGNSKISNAAGTYRQWIRTRGLVAFRNASFHNAIYINGCDKVLHNYNYITTGDNLIHPNASGHEAIASYLYNALKGGSYDYYAEQSATAGNLPSGTTGELLFKTGIENDKSFLMMATNLTYTTPLYHGYMPNIDLGEQNLQYLRFVNTSTSNESSEVSVNVLYTDDTHGTLPCKVKITNDNHISIKLGYVEKDIKAINMTYSKFYWDYLMV